MIESSFDSPYTFEELQFFSGQYYEKGLNWYMDLFPERGNRTIKIFEKSATYFDSTSATSRVKGISVTETRVCKLYTEVSFW